jgi:hypothetical protein
MLQRIYDHEGGHSLFSERDFDKLNATLKKWKVPFRLFNLFEDGRIEAAWRKKFSRRFNWLRFMLLFEELPPAPIPDPPGTPMNACGLFLDCIKMENSHKLLAEWVGRDKDPKIQYQSKGKSKYGRRYLIRWFYRRAIKASSSLDLMGIMASWVKTFPETAGKDYVIILGPAGEDVPENAEMVEMPDYVEDADGSKHKEIKATTALSGSAPGTRSDLKLKPAEKTEDYKGASKRIEVPPGIFFSPDRERTMDCRRADRLIHLFERFLEGGEAMETSRNPSGRIDWRRFLRGAEDIFLRRGDTPYGVKDISFFLDVSGSMSGPIEEGVILAYILNELVRRRKISCRHMILCGGTNQSVSMPFDPEILNYLLTPGGTEGFVEAMRKHEREIATTDLSIFFTDGDITDEHINKEEWHCKGVYSIGLFVGSASKSENLHRWFDSVLVRDSIEGVADSLIQLIKRS